MFLLTEVYADATVLYNFDTELEAVSAANEACAKQAVEQVIVSEIKHRSVRIMAEVK